MGEVHPIRGALVDEKAEKATLGGMLASEGHPLDCREEVIEHLQEVGSSAFHDPRHRVIYVAVIDCMLENRPTDAVSVVAQLRHNGDLVDGLDQYVHGLPQEAGVLTGVVYDAKIVLDLYRKRELNKVLIDGSAHILSGEGLYEETAGEIASAVSDIVDKAVKPETLHTAVEVADAALGHIFGSKKVEPGIPMGFVDLDAGIGGMRPGQMIVLAGRPSHGKTSLGAQVGRNVAEQGVGVLMFSLEMSKEELGQRNAAADNTISFTSIRDAEVTDEEIVELGAWVERQADVPFYVDDAPSQTVGEIYLKTRKMIKEADVKVVIVDYLQLAKPDKPTGIPTIDVAMVSEGLRRMARKLGITVIALAQLNRDSSSRDDGKPKITDLRQSGQIEQDAHQVILIHYDRKANPDTDRGNEVDLMVVKNRSGVNFETVVEMEGEYARLRDPMADIARGIQ